MNVIPDHNESLKIIKKVDLYLWAFAASHGIENEHFLSSQTSWLLIKRMEVTS